MVSPDVQCRKGDRLVRISESMHTYADSISLSREGVEPTNILLCANA